MFPLSGLEIRAGVVAIGVGAHTANEYEPRAHVSMALATASISTLLNGEQAQR